MGMRDGNFVVNIKTVNSRGEKGLAGTTEVAQPNTVYVFTGQGSQKPGMGMDLYNNSPAARSDTPKEKMIHFGGIKGQAIRQRYMDMTYHTMDKDGNVKTPPLFGDINIALVVTQRAAFEDMCSKGLVQKESHSLATPWESTGPWRRSPTSYPLWLTSCSTVDMCAVNPSRISKAFNDASLREVVEDIAQRTGCLLEIVNFNVEGQQYVCAGELVALQTLTNVLNYLKIQKVDIAKFTVDQVKELLGEIVKSSYPKAKEQQTKEGYIKFEHPSKKINPAHLNPDILVGKYVTNLVAKPFQVSKEHAQLIYDQTLSPRLDKDNWGSAEQRQKLAWVILIELLAYQFASPVRWTETQDILFRHYHFERFIEIWPSPTLGYGDAHARSRQSTRSRMTPSPTARAIFCHAKRTKEV
ncbi:hypothetical protein OH77DRAFT_1594520 [Trametes cingulata]|nr:hypothetical protein OH77DRAFT_1594520 [Trametes cingulata]